MICRIKYKRFKIPAVQMLTFAAFLNFVIFWSELLLVRRNKKYKYVTFFDTTQTKPLTKKITNCLICYLNNHLRQPNLHLAFFNASGIINWMHAPIRSSLCLQKQQKHAS